MSRARRKTRLERPEIRVRLNEDILTRRPDTTATVARIVDTLRQGMPYAEVDVAGPPRPARRWAYAACVLFGAVLGAGAMLALQHREALLPAPEQTATVAAAPEPAPEPPAPEPPAAEPPAAEPPAAPAPARAYTLGIPDPAALPADYRSADLARELAVCAGFAVAVLAKTAAMPDLDAAVADANRALERATARQAGRAEIPDETLDRWLAEGADAARAVLDTGDLRGALRRLAECRPVVAREVALPR